MRGRTIALGLTAMALAGLVFVLSSPPGAEPGTTPREGAQDAQQRRLEQLQSLPYVNVVSADGEKRVGVTTFDAERAQRGFNLHCSRVTNEIFLQDLEGRVVNSWSFPEGNPSPEELAGRSRGVAATAVLVGDGRLLALRKNLDLTLFSWQGDILWQKPIRGHHDLVAPGDGTAFLLQSRLVEYRGAPVGSPVVLHLNVDDGSAIDSWAAADQLAEIRTMLGPAWFLDELLDHREEVIADGVEGRALRAATKRKFGVGVAEADGGNIDLFHSNTISLIPENPLGEKDARFRPGNLVLCFRNLDTVAILDWESKELVWHWGPGDLEHPHHPTMLANGHLLVFDNGVRRKHSRVVEVDPATGEIVWQYQAPEPADFFSPTKGSAQRLDNGNTLICNADHGRVFEVTAEGEIVWEWQSPVIDDPAWLQPFQQRIGDPPFRTVVYRMLRLSPDQLRELGPPRGFL